jgi:hypothetical protein
MDKELLFKPRCPERSVELPGLGEVRVRGLTRAEIKIISDREERGKDSESWIIATCLLDPELSEEDAQRWLDVAQFGEIETLTDAINALSGIGKYANKESYKSLPDQPDAGVRPLPSGEAVDDGGGATGADVER